jgi:glutathione peroxidase
MIETIYEFSAKRLSGEEEFLSVYKDKVLLIVNTASKCGFTPQYEGLEKLHEELSPRGFEILGFPCNQFSSQEPGSSEEIASFCKLSYQVAFPMFEKIDVNGKGTHPLYKFLKSDRRGIVFSEAIKWNFTKFLIDVNGVPVNRYAPRIKPEEMRGDIENLLNAK